MVQRVSTVAFEGIEARAVDVQVQVAPGLPAFTIVGPNNQNRASGYLSQPLRRPDQLTPCGDSKARVYNTIKMSGPMSPTR